MGVIDSFREWLDEGTYTEDEREFAKKTDSNSTRAMAYYAGYLAGKKEAQQVIQPDNAR